MGSGNDNLRAGIEGILEILWDVSPEKLVEVLNSGPQVGDAFAGIVIAQLPLPGIAAGDGQTYEFYAGRIDPGRHVNAHFYRRGNVPYAIRRGSGVMHLGPIGSGRINWKTPAQRVPDRSGHRGIIVPMYVVHSLENTGDGPLVFGFACPQSPPSGDRVFTTDSPNGTPKYTRRR